MRNVYLVTALAVVLVVSILGLRGTVFTAPPMDVFPEWAFPGMKRQSKYKPQAQSKFFADGRADRPLPAGVVAANYGPLGRPLQSDSHLLTGKLADGSFARGFPESIEVNHQFLAHGRERYSIYCAPCHGALGDGNGITKSYGMGATPTYHDERLREIAEGEILNTILHGKGNMLSYADKLTIEESWAVIAYVRALQLAHNGSPADVPAAHKPALGLK
ncbi:cytochrome C [Cephaloticoccus primus]|uniref:Cytochrome C n=1 Tax=Cephaloticoccus primus TaxID=1548207 RepID=A0A139SJG1_9BACT|nr:cytochrome c [Cephaloticoccus primus]KXU34671.1 cytochrome C [Cephaloticoccus primus]